MKVGRGFALVRPIYYDILILATAASSAVTAWRSDLGSDRGIISTYVVARIVDKESGMQTKLSKTMESTLNMIRNEGGRRELWKREKGYNLNAVYALRDRGLVQLENIDGRDYVTII